MARTVSVALVARADTVEILESGRDKAKCLAAAKDYIATAKPSELEEVFLLSALGGAVQYRKRLLPSAADVVVEDLEDDDQSADASAIREALKAKGVKVPPRIGLDKLLELAIANGVEV